MSGLARLRACRFQPARGVPRPLIDAMAATLEAGAALLAVLDTGGASTALEDRRWETRSMLHNASTCHQSWDREARRLPCPESAGKKPVYAACPEPTSGSAHAYARGVSCAGLAAWAWEELIGGVNWVRRDIGAAG